MQSKPMVRIGVSKNFVQFYDIFSIIFGIGDHDIKGCLLTPEEGCGFTKVRNTRIVGGSEAPIGKNRRLIIIK